LAPSRSSVLDAFNFATNKRPVTGLMRE